jgi:hypothetical protein
MTTKLDRLRRVCDALVEALESHSEKRRTDRCLTSLDNGRGAIVEDRDEPSALTVQPARSEAGLWTVGQVADHYAVTRDFVYAHANELGGVRLGAARGRACGSIRQPARPLGAGQRTAGDR